jgi:hypothetical protein
LTLGAEKKIIGVIAQVAAACVDGASILELCVNGDKAIEEGVKTVYTKGKINKGTVSFAIVLTFTRIQRVLKDLNNITNRLLVFSR